MALNDISIHVVSTPKAGYGTDPNLVMPSSPWLRTLLEDERRLIAALSDTILPARNEFPPPSAMGIVDFFDEWVSAPYPQQQADRELILSGLALLDLHSKQSFSRSFPELTLDEKRKIVTEFAYDAKATTESLKRSFFKKFRYLLVGGYFTSDIGFKAIGYIGNVPLRTYLGVTPEVGQIIEKELTRLGLSKG